MNTTLIYLLMFTDTCLVMTALSALYRFATT